MRLKHNKNIKQRLMKLNNYILCNENAVYYECNYSCDNLIFICLGDEKFFITDGRYDLDANLNAKDCQVIITKDLTKTPLNPVCNISEMAPTSGPITGTPDVIASNATNGKPSI